MDRITLAALPTNPAPAINYYMYRSGIHIANIVRIERRFMAERSFVAPRPQERQHEPIEARRRYLGNAIDAANDALEPSSFYKHGQRRRTYPCFFRLSSRHEPVLV
ncbi:conserved domain protein [Eggerthella sp. HGA1]|nr:conserved domain protein [Eggerthella sp. HGA1]